MDTLLTLLSADFFGTPAWSWLLFIGIVVALLAFDLGVLHKEDREIGVRESLLLSAGYITAALLFGAWVWWQMGAASGMAQCYMKLKKPRAALKAFRAAFRVNPHIQGIEDTIRTLEDVLGEEGKKEDK